MRRDGRAAGQHRPTTIIPNYLKDPEGSALVRAGDTWVLCTASVEERVPAWMKEREPRTGWVTAEYGMLPRATHTRSSRAPSGRGKEIERLIGRALRASIDLGGLGTRSITVDCDVLQADGGTRTAAITGGFVALALACRRLVADAGIENPIREPIAAISVGIVDGEPRLDLAYEEDARASVDMNVVMTAAGRFVEVQGTAEGAPFERRELDALCDLASDGIRSLLAIQAEALRS
jgi:ribonuclease PH